MGSNKAVANDWEDVPLKATKVADDWEDVPVASKAPKASNLTAEETAKASVLPRTPKPTVFDSWVRGLAQGVTLGHSDEIVGAGKGIAAAVSDKGESGVGTLMRAVSAYKKGTTAERAANDAALATNPGTYRTANVVGGTIPAVALAPETVIGGIGAAAAQGGLAGHGYSEKSVASDPVGLGEDVAGGALAGTLFQGAFSAVGKVLPTVANVRKFSNTLATKSAGYLGSDLKKLSPEERQTIGAAIHKAGLRAFDSLDEVGAKLTAAKQDAGKDIGKALDSVDDLVNQAKAQVDEMPWPDGAKQAFKAKLDQNYQFNQERIAERIEKELIAPNLKNPLLRIEREQMQQVADDFRANGPTTMREGNVVKGTQGRKTNFNSETVPQAFKKEVYTIIKDELDSVVGKTGTLEAAVAKNAAKGNPNTPQIGDAPDMPRLDEGSIAARNQSVLGEYVKAKKTYGPLRAAEKVNLARQGSTEGNRVISLTDTIAGVGGFASGGPVTAVVLGGLNKAIRKYGDSVGAVATKNAADMFERAPASMGKFYLMFKDAATKGGVGSVTALQEYLMQKSPEYRKLLDQYANSQREAK